MSKKGAANPPARLSRRAVLGAGAALPVGLAATATVTATAESATTDSMPGMDGAAHAPSGSATPAPAPTTALEGLETLNAVEMEALEAFCARLVPTDEHGPGAAEARVAHYIDRSLAGALMNLRAVYAAGLSALDALATVSKGKVFAELATADQDALMRDMEAGKAPGFVPSSAAFFGMVRAHTIEGMFCDPYYGGNADFVGWDLIGYPGLRMSVLPEDQRLQKPAILRASAYGPGLFGRSKAR